MRISPNGTVLLKVENDDILSNGSFTIPPGITSIGLGAFAGCDRLQTITLPHGITSIDHWAFANCTNLKSITLPQEITSIGKGAFANCRSLQSITLPPEVISIGSNVFDQCPSLHSIIIEGSDEDCERIKALLPPQLQDKVTSANLATQAYQALEAQLTRIENTASLNPLHRHLNIDKHPPSMLINGQKKECPLIPDELFQHMNGFIADSLPAYQQAKTLMQQQPLPTTQAALETYQSTLARIVNIALATHARQNPSDFAKHLYFLKKKGEFFTRTQQQPQAVAVEKLHQQLMHSYIHTLPHNGRQFQEECRQAIQDARNELEQQRGWGLILSYLLLLATGLGALVVLADVGYHYATGKHCSFFQTTTDKQLNILEDSLKLPDQDQQCSIN
ncbi:MAG TPA: leucine-rich repeat domain-containing protein [Cellvibrio sp.]